MFIHRDKGRNFALKFTVTLFSTEKYYSDDETISVIDDVCSRMAPLNDNACFTLDNRRTFIYWLQKS